DFATYLVTSLQLTLIVPFAGASAFVDTYVTFLGIFAVTQLPIAMAEGVLMVFFFKYLAFVRPELIKDIGYRAKQSIGGILDAKRREKKDRSRMMLASFIVVLAAMMLFAYITTFFFDIGGSDDAGAGAIEILIPGYDQWTDNFIQVGEFGISILFLIQTTVGVLILASVLYLLVRKKKHDHGSEFNTVDTAAYASPMARWSPLAKLLLVLSLLVINIASPSIWMAVFTGIIGFALLLYASSLKPPAIMLRLFAYAQIFIVIGALIFAIVTNGETVMRITIFGFAINFTDAGVSLALLIYARATAALLLMFAFAASTPVPHLSAALRKLRLPDVFVEMMVLIYRYTFLLMESAERMHLAAECRFGYSGYGKKMRTTSKLAAGVFIRSLDTAERGQITLQCRNYKGEFRSLSEFEGRKAAPMALCVLIVTAAAIILLYTRGVFTI
ncbi:MAG: cobalt ECF transporter T component CbiQ, partial [Candidatus Methanoplasma sp.]|nr:cobalt ECF transporter T component CbiQ [Candidatus Methanoplasma sp.]